MQKIIILTLFINTILFSCRVNEIEQDKLEYRNGIYYEINSNDPYTGVVKSYHENGQLKSECNYINGEREGRLKLEENYKVGESTGKIKYYDINGKL